MKRGVGEGWNNLSVHLEGDGGFHSLLLLIVQGMFGSSDYFLIRIILDI
jgi:hypothetical protein